MFTNMIKFVGKHAVTLTVGTVNALAQGAREGLAQQTADGKPLGDLGRAGVNAVKNVANKVMPQEPKDEQ